MKQNKWLVLSFLGVFIFFGMMSSVDCNLFWIHDGPGYKSVLIVVFLVLGALVSTITLLIQILKASQTLVSKVGGIVFLFALVFVLAVTASHFAKTYCH